VETLDNYVMQPRQTSEKGRFNSDKIDQLKQNKTKKTTSLKNHIDLRLCMNILSKGLLTLF